MSAKTIISDIFSDIDIDSVDKYDNITKVEFNLIKQQISNKMIQYIENIILNANNILSINQTYMNPIYGKKLANININIRSYIIKLESIMIQLKNNTIPYGAFLDVNNSIDIYHNKINNLITDCKSLYSSNEIIHVSAV